MPPLAVAALPSIIGAVGSIGGGLLANRGAKKGAGSAGGIYGQMAQKDLSAGSDYFNKVLSDPSEATATTTSDLGRQFQQGVNFNARNVSRGGGASSKIAEAPFQLASAAKGQQIMARMGAAKNLADIGSNAGRLDLGQQGLDIERTQSNRSFWSDIGSSIGGFLTQPGGLSSTSILGRLGGILSKKAPGAGDGSVASNPGIGGI